MPGPFPNTKFRRPVPRNVENIQTGYEEDPNMRDAILITYATKCGSTAEIARAISESLCEKGMSVDVRPMKSVSDLNGYRAVVIGSAIRMGKWLPEALEFVARHQNRLAQMPTAAFTVHMLNTDDTPESRSAREGYVAPLHQLLSPGAEAFFAGKIDLACMSLFDRLISKAMKATDQDLRDWDKIRSWADSLTAMVG
jgi:menaquinone-dependent protoporphyrinogen oxidase